MHFTNIFNKDLKQAIDENFSNIDTENVGPFVYSIIKTIRPKKILEIGAGYTSIFFAKALQEINEEDSFDNDLINKQSELPEWNRRKKMLCNFDRSYPT